MARTSVIDLGWMRTCGKTNVQRHHAEAGGKEAMAGGEQMPGHDARIEIHT